jgi:hypothetical protein
MAALTTSMRCAVPSGASLRPGHAADRGQHERASLRAEDGHAASDDVPGLELVTVPTTCGYVSNGRRFAHPRS